jgi:predicted  nucleic acid-binding Zn-ribbon protein
MTAGADLYHLQDIDRDGDKKRRRLSEVEAALGESQVLHQARRAVEAAQERVRAEAVRQRDLELEVGGLADKIVQEEQRLYSGMVKNPKELEDLQTEVAALKRRRQQLEGNLLEVMIAGEEAESELAQAQSQLDKVQADWSEQQSELISERDALKVALDEIAQAREALLPRIKAGDLASYQSLRKRKSGIAVAELRDGACGACGVTITPGLEWQLRQGKLVACSNCERILVRL